MRGHRRRPGAPTALDWTAAVAVALACIALAAMGVDALLEGTVLGAAMLAFGAIGISFGGRDLLAFRATGESRSDAAADGTDEDRREPSNWQVAHLQRMIAALIATVSAVSAVTLGPQLGVVAWRWPTAVGSPLIARWSARYEKG